MYDNKIIPVTIHENSSKSDLNLLNIQANSTGSGQWVHYGTDVKIDIDISGIAAAAATAAVLAVVGYVNPVVAAMIGAAVAKFLDDNVSGVVALNLKKVSYYWNPITTQIPKTKTDFYLYSGTGCKPQNLLCQF